jgi:predicted RNA-binding Zn-ribbon protein involved in translation (DUF1610 family)
MMLSTVRVRKELLRKYAQVRFESLPQAIQERLWYGYGGRREEQNPSEEKLWEHEMMRVRTMSRDDLIRRIYKMTHPDKLATFVQVLRQKGMDDLARLANRRLREVGGAEQNPVMGMKDCPKCGRSVLQDDPYQTEVRCPGCGKIVRFETNGTEQNPNKLKGCLADDHTVKSTKKQLKKAGCIIEGDTNDAFTAKLQDTGEVIYRAIRKDSNTWLCMYDPAFFSGESAEQNPEQNPITSIPKGAPEKKMETAIEAYARFHDFDPDKITKVELPQPKVIVKLGGFTSIGYASEKWKHQRKLKQKYRGKKVQHYIHEFKDVPKSERIVAFAPDEKNPEFGTIICWGRVRVTKHGIEDLKE